MKSQNKILFLLGGLLLLTAVVLAACGPKETPTLETATAEPTEAPAMPDATLELVSADATTSITYADILALTATEGYGGWIRSTGAIEPPAVYRGVALRDIAEILGGLGENNGIEITASDGYSMTLSYEQVMNGTFVAFDPATGEELKTPVELTAILAYEREGEPLPETFDGAFRLMVVSAEPVQVVDGHWTVKFVTTVTLKELVSDWVLSLDGAITVPIDRGSFESCSAPQCHGATWVDEEGQEWVGIPLYLAVGYVDDDIKHDGPAYNDALADAGYTVDVVASDGFTATFDSALIKRNANILLVYQVGGAELPEKYFPLRLVGANLTKREMVGMVATIVVNVPAGDASIGTVGEYLGPGNLEIKGLVNQPLNLGEGNLRALEVVTITAEQPGKDEATFEGVRLNGLLDLAGIQDGATKVVFTADDGYSAEASLEDIRACNDCLVAFTDTEGTFKMVLPGLGGGTWVKGVVSIEVK